MMFFYKNFFLAFLLSANLYAASNTPSSDDLPEITTPLAALHIPVQAQEEHAEAPHASAAASLPVQTYQPGQRVHLVDLPDEVLSHIFSFLDMKGLSQLSLASRRTHAICYDVPRSLTTHRSAEGYPWDTGKITSLRLRLTHITNNIDDEVLKSWLPGLTNLRSLDVEYHCNRLLRVPQPRMSSQTMKTLIQSVLPNLHELSFDQSLTSESLGLLVECLPANTALRSLSLRGNPRSDDEGSRTRVLSDLVIALKDNSGSRINKLGLVMVDSVKADEVFFPLVELVQLNRLTSLNLSGCNLGLEKANFLLSALEENTSITSFNFARNDLGLASATSVARMLKQNRSLESLDLTGNKLEPSGCTEIMKVFINDEHTPTQNTTLRDLNISHNAVLNNDGTIRAICELVRTNTTLRSLNLMNSHLGAFKIRDIILALRGNPHTGLQSLNLQVNISAEDIGHLRKLIPDSLQGVVLL